MRKLLLATLISGTLLGCSESKFNGDQASGDIDKAEDEQTNQSDGKSQSDANSQSCSSASETTITSETDSIVNKAPNQFVRYQIGLKGCNTSVLKDASIRADVNAQVSSARESLSYEILTKAGETIAEGTLSSISGKDLFGNVGSTWSYWETESIDIPFDDGLVILEIDFSNIAFGRIDDIDFDEDNIDRDITIDSHFSLSGAKPVTVPMTILSGK